MYALLFMPQNPGQPEQPNDLQGQSRIYELRPERIGVNGGHPLRLKNELAGIQNVRHAGNEQRRVPYPGHLAGGLDAHPVALPNDSVRHLQNLCQIAADVPLDTQCLREQPYAFGVVESDHAIERLLDVEPELETPQHLLELAADLPFGPAHNRLDRACRRSARR